MNRTPPGVNAQLRAFYDAQGLTGQHRRRAIQHDRRRIREEAIRQFGSPFDPAYENAHDGLMCAFVWKDTREGTRYWSDRNDAILKAEAYL